MRKSGVRTPPSAWLSPMGPIVIGLGYGLAMHLPGGMTLDDLYWQSPFMFSALAGLTIAYACRPVLARIDWSRWVALWLAWALLAGMGPVTEWLAAEVATLSRLAPFPLNLPHSPAGLLLSVAVAGPLMARFFRPAGGEIGAAGLYERWQARRLPAELGRLAALGLWALAVWLGAGWLDAHWAATATGHYVPLVEPNPWGQVLALLAGRGGVAGAAALLAIRWVRALLLLAPLLPISLTLRGSWAQLTLVFTMLLFVIGEFAPLVADQPYPSASWLLTRTALGLGRAFLLGGATAALFGQAAPQRMVPVQDE